jgi:alpha-tubulin suppressor-like RCC1 family protein
VRQNTPARIGTDNDWVSVSAGEMHVMGVKRDGTLWAWGKNTTEQFGIGVRPDFSMIPLRVGAERNWKSVSVGFGYTLAIKKDSTLWSWGGNANGMLGTGSSNNEPTPVQIGKDRDWRTVEAGQFHAMAIKYDGTLWSWGANQNGQLGNGDSKEQRSPAQVGSDKWKAVACGAQHSLGIKEDGTLWTWGAITGGLGSDMVRKPTPMRVGTASNWVAVAAGNLHSLGAQSDGSVWAWGNNTDGALGVGNNTFQFVPVKVK